jgi:hypothetical protein
MQNGLVPSRFAEEVALAVSIIALLFLRQSSEAAVEMLEGDADTPDLSEKPGESLGDLHVGTQTEKRKATKGD